MAVRAGEEEDQVPSEMASDMTGRPVGSSVSASIAGDGAGTLADQQILAVTGVVQAGDVTPAT